ncbi:MAG TPA: hypothetical protein VEI02_01280, partial [Planctomycetota bacterium]|nr:hypothetical protein [Planctomycetota bacterium]
MKTFRFRLRRLAAVRRLEERQAEGARLLAEARLRDVDASRDAMTADRDALLGGLATTLRAGGGSPEAPRRALEHA